MHHVLPAYGLADSTLRVEPLGSGLINHTWKINAGGQEYILQKINHAVFKQPENIAHNIRVIAAYLKEHFPAYTFVAPVRAHNGAEMICTEGGGYYRLFPFVAGSRSKDVLETPAQAYEAAVQFGRFTRLLSGLDVGLLKVTIPSFHDLSLRYQQFLQALEKGNPLRIASANTLIRELKACSHIVDAFQQVKANPDFKLRVTHHDTKISNVLFSSEDKGLCVIDLDTVMPGYFISDVGDMMRTYLSPVSEEEQDFSKIQVREEFYRAVVQGYYSEMKDELTETEKGYFFYAGQFMIYMQAIRFLTDYLNNDVYYGAKYPKHNLVRAQNQTVLLQRLMEKRAVLAACLETQSQPSEKP